MTATLGSAVQACRYIALHVTPYCNLQCKYCFEAAPAMPKRNAPGSRFMELQTAVRAVDLALKQTRAEHVDVLLFGGEPLLIGLDWLTTATRAFRASAQRYGKSLKIALTTNGTAVTQAVADGLKAADIGVCVSIDGPPDIHDRSRGGSKSMVKGLAMLRKAGLQLNTICVINPHNADHIDETIDFLLSQGITKGRFTPMTYAGTASQGFEFADTAVPIQAVLKVFDHMLQSRGDGFVDLPLMRRIAHFSAATIGLTIAPGEYDCYTKTCWAGAGYLAVSQDGALYPCSRCVEEQYRLGDLDGQMSKDTRAVLEHLHGTGLETFHCDACRARPMCFGGCAAHNKADDRNFSLDCELTRALFGAFEEHAEQVLDLNRELQTRHGRNAAADERDGGHASDAEALHILDILQKTHMTPVFAARGGVIFSNGTDNYLVDPQNGDACAVADEAITVLRNP